MFIPHKILEDKLKQMLAEDVGQGDITAQAVIPENLNAKGTIIAKDKGVAAGIEEAKVLANYLGLEVKAKVADGEKIKNKQVLMELYGDARTMLSAERTMLNILSRMSGIATSTQILAAKLVKAGVKARVAATRKSAPGLLYFDKKAVTIGGGDAHRLHLDDMILIKDNHIALVGSVEEAVKKAKTNASFSKKIEVEVSKPLDALKAAEAGADVIMLDNFSIHQVKEAVGLLDKNGFLGKVILEVSGRINPKNILDYASAKVDVISVGELTHSIKALDLSLEIKK